MQQRVFLSHSWKDKALARRIARRLSHRGIAVWIDEAEMQIGDRLSARLADEIRRSSHFLILLTSAALTSKWVMQEIEIAKSSEQPIPIIPIIAERDVSMAQLDESFGVSIIDPWFFEERLDTVAKAVLGQTNANDRDIILVRRDLSAIANQTPEIRGLVEQLQTGKITHAQLDALTIEESLRHPTETALIALHECANSEARYVISLVAAQYFCQLGVGYEVLRRQIECEPPGSDALAAMFNHLGQALTRAEDIDGAFRLFEMSQPPKDQAFAEFVRRNFSKFDRVQQHRAVRIVTIPERGPAGFSVDAAFELFARLPHSTSLRTLWWFWVHDYKFGGHPDVDHTQNSVIFFNLMNDAAERGLEQFTPIADYFEERFRGLVRSGDVRQVFGAVYLLNTAADTRYLRRKGLARQLMDAVHSAEWNSFEYRGSLRSPVWKLGQAVAADEDYSDALEALSHVIERIAQRRTPIDKHGVQ